MLLAIFPSVASAQTSSAPLPANNGTARNLILTGNSGFSLTIPGLGHYLFSLQEVGGRPALGSIDGNGSFSPLFFLDSTQNGAIQGTGTQTWPAPDPEVKGRLTLTSAPAPLIRFRSTLAGSKADIWQDEGGSINIDPGNSHVNLYGDSLNAYSTALNIYARAMNVESHDVNMKGSVISLSNASTDSSLQVWQNSDGNSIISAHGKSNTLTIFAREINVQAVPQYWGTTSDTRLCGSLAGSTGCRPMKDSEGNTHYEPYW